MWSILGQSQSRSCQLVFLEPGPQHSYHLKINFSSKEIKNIANLTERAIHGSVHQVMITIWHGAFEDHLFLNKPLASYLTPGHVQIDSGMWKSDICANTFLHFWPPYPRAMLSFVSAASFKTWSMRAFLFLVSSIRTGLASGRFWTNRWIRTQLNQLFTTTL